MDDNLRIWRSFSIGTLLDLIMLDTRHYDRSITDLYWNTHYVHQISDDVSNLSEPSLSNTALRAELRDILQEQNSPGTFHDSKLSPEEIC